MGEAVFIFSEKKHHGALDSVAGKAILRIVLNTKEPLMRIPHRSFLTSCLAICAILAVPAALPAAQTNDSVVWLHYQNNRFAPQTLNVAAGEPLILKVLNSSKRTIEFESFKLNREQVLQPGQTITVHLPALSTGSYDFYDDFHQDVPEGTIVAR
ncbi:MAG: cupredoxin domain-containing protein [Candidatus Binataceae bacterium]